MSDLTEIPPEALEKLSDEGIQRLAQQLLEEKERIRKETQILTYRPASAGADQAHHSFARKIGIGGGNRSGKTESMLAEEIALATGVFPYEYEDVFRQKFRGPINVRICVETFSSILHQTLLPKLQWWKWTGFGKPGTDQGHWGWVPRSCLKDGDWDKSWLEKRRTLTILCRDPDDPDRVLGESTLQIMSYDMEWTDFASGTFHIVHMDEPPPYSIWRENQARVLDVDGRIFLTMTWPNDPSIAVDYIYDEMYEPGQPGPLKNPDVDWFELYTLDNIHLNREAIIRQTANWSESDKKVKLRGQPLRFSNRIHPLFTDTPQFWCFQCSQPTMPIHGECTNDREAHDGTKVPCGSIDIAEYTHIEDFDWDPLWPVGMVIDPHPRKPHMMAWIGIDPNDDYYMIVNEEIEGDATDVKVRVDELEENYKFDVRIRLMDPNMGASPTSKREVTWQDEFANAGLQFDLADQSDVGRKRVNQYLKPDHHTRRPRLVLHSRCLNPAIQMKRFVWDDFKRTQDRDVKQTPKPKYDDYPAILRYWLNYQPEFRQALVGAPIIGSGRARKAAYG